MLNKAVRSASLYLSCHPGYPYLDKDWKHALDRAGIENFLLA
ncbi:MAG: hypothetical protein ACKVHQ_02845 [Gammaproteobacteria bacterium]|jgi:hypothetical protein